MNSPNNLKPSMAAGILVVIKKIPLLLVASFFTYVFVASAMVATVVSLLLLFLWPVAATAYRKITSGLAYTIFGQVVWLCMDYANLRIHIFGDEEAYANIGQEFHLVTSSHRGNLDWISGFVLGFHYGFLHSIRSLPKKSVLYVPGFGQLLWALEYPFLNRNNYQKDRIAINKCSKTWRTYPFPIQVAIYCEGTRFTKEKHEQGLKYAREKGLPLLKHHLVPKTKGFALLAEHLRGGNFKAVYDVAVAYPGGPPNSTPTHLDILLGETMDIFWYMRRIPMEELPETHEELNKYCYELFQHKDEAYEHFLKHNEFPGPRQKLPPFGYKLWRLRVIVVTWALLLTVFPLYGMSLAFSLTTNLLLIASFIFSTLVLFSGMVIYGKGKNASFYNAQANGKKRN